ncbi:MAG TPA: thioredoxin family protein [Chitinophagaceae bacterium]|nr:thioredoxin family protein [Chitinophagaceae bacterium]
MTPLLKKLIVTFSVLFFVALSAFSQDSAGAVHDWKIASKKIGENKYELSFNGTISGNWQVYAPNQTILDVKTTELQFPDSSIVQEGDFIPEGTPKTISSLIFENTKVSIYETSAEWKVIVSIHGAVPAKLQGTLLYTYGKNDEYYPSTVYPFVVALQGGVESSTKILVPSIDIDHPVNDCGDTINKNSSLFAIFLLGFLGGLIALLTPCVFPMIPLTVSFFTKQAEDRKRGIANAVKYGFFIFLIYVLLTVPFHIARNTNGEIFNNISTGAGLNLFFFVIFVLFAFSFFGYYEIALPASLANRMNSKAGIGNTSGIFFMALTLAIVSFSCTGAVFGTFLVSVLEQGPWPLTAVAAGFGLALGLPFALFAMFPRWLHAIPKSGGWMTELKVVLGFVELGLAVKFLANADNVKQWGVLKREIFIGIWVILGLCIIVYLAGLFRRHTRVKFTFWRIAFVLLFAGFPAYLVPGLFNTHAARLKLISGFPPPFRYSIYKNSVNNEKPLLDYEAAILLAKKENKPVLIDFTGWACVNCRRMEEKVWTNSKVEKLMKENFILVSLYVDERTKLPQLERTVYTTKSGSQKSIITVGDKWTTFQIENFKATAQPQYSIISPDEKALAKTKFYTPNPSEFAQWLKCGLDAFKKTKN